MYYRNSKRNKSISSCCFAMSCFKPIRSPKMVAKYEAKQDALNMQRIQVLWKDVENLVELSRFPYSRGGRILQRIDQCMEKMDDIAKEVIMDHGMMKKFLEYRKNLEKLALEMSSNDFIYGSR
ncbi:hypothetical protein BLOT_007679 [Blomia tropicalis]|nr:hypothetical protein BLOT_007679 [Blomia tropicalis]